MANKKGFRFKWTKEKIDYLIENYKYGNWDDLFLNLETDDRLVVRNKAKQLKLKQDSFWNSDRENFLKENYWNGDWDYILNYLGLNDRRNVITRASLLGLKRDENLFSDEEIAFLKKNYENMTCKELADILGRPLGSIMQKVNRIGLKKNPSGYYWTNEELEILKKEYSNNTNKRMQEKFLPNRNIDSIIKMAEKLGLEKSEEKGCRHYHPDDAIEDLKELAENLGRTPLGSELLPNGLPGRSVYIYYFGGYPNACKIAGLIPNHGFIGHGNLGYKFSKNGDICYSNSEVIITNFLIDKNIPYKKEEFYRDYCDDPRCTRKRVDWVIDNNIFIEFFGFPKHDFYKIKMETKIDICKSNNIKLIDLYEKDLKNLDLIFKDFMN